jgi:hypothetical protein
MAKRKPKPAVDTITVESTEALEQTTEPLMISTIGQKIGIFKDEEYGQKIGIFGQKLGIFKDEEYEITTETSKILEAAMRLYGQGKTTADHMASMIDTLETNRETSPEEKIAAYGKLLHDTFVAISKLGYDPVAVFKEFVDAKECSVKKKHQTPPDYSKAKV